MKKIKTYVGTDGKLHFIDATGADSVLPFKSVISPTLVATNAGYSGKKGKTYLLCGSLSGGSYPNAPSIVLSFTPTYTLLSHIAYVNSSGVYVASYVYIVTLNNDMNIDVNLSTPNGAMPKIKKVFEI